MFIIIYAKIIASLLVSCILGARSIFYIKTFIKIYLIKIKLVAILLIFYKLVY